MKANEGVDRMSFHRVPRLGSSTFLVIVVSSNRYDSFTFMFNASERKVTRSNKAARDIDILPDFKGTAIHDHWKPYYHFNDCTNTECNAQHLRTLRDIVENYYQDWPDQMTVVVIKVYRRVEAL